MSTFNCRLFDRPDLPKPLHVHDSPGYVADALRNRKVGWHVSLDRCIALDLPFTSGDPGVKSNPTILEAVSR